MLLLHSTSALALVEIKHVDEVGLNRRLEGVD